MGAVDMDVIHGGDDPGMAEDLLDRGQVHPVGIQLAGAEMPQQVRGHPALPVRQVNRSRGGERGPQRLIPDPGAGPVGVLAL
jgi:hypothetical protein